MLQDSPTLALAKDLITRASLTPDDQGCNKLLMDRLTALGFECETLNFGKVRNFWARLGNSAPLLCFAGHTDVVPTGPLEQWRFPPFVPTIDQGILYGRGAADMKGSIAAMVTACERILTNSEQHGQLKGSLAFLITSDEEGAAVEGTRKVVEVLEARNEKIDYCIIGEPSSTTTTGDVIKIGRRGSLHGRLRFHGVQGHIAYPHLADNPIHAGVLPLHALCSEVWDAGNDAFPPTSFQISNIRAGTGADNVIPDSLEVIFNFRFSTASTATQLQARVESILQQHTIKYSLEWQLSGEAFLTDKGDLIDVVRDSVHEVMGIMPELSTSGGTSDGRFIAPTGAQLVELGPCNASIHKINEHVSVSSLDELSLIYEQVVRRLLLN